MALIHSRFTYLFLMQVIDYLFFLLYTMYSCFPEDFPLYIGVVVPFAVIYIFNVIMFVLILLSVSYSDINVEDAIECRQNALSGLILAVTFGLAWIFGLLGTSGLPSAVRLAFIYLFGILVGIQGLLTFVLRVLRQEDILNELKEKFHALSDTLCGVVQNQLESAIEEVEANIGEQVDAAIDDSDTLHTALQQQLESVTEVDATIEELPVTIPQVQNLTVIENRQIADDLDWHESGVPALVTSELLEPSILSSPLVTLPDQPVQQSDSQHSHGYYFDLEAAVSQKQTSRKKDSHSQEFFIGEKILARNMRSGPHWLPGTVIGQKGSLSYLVQVANGVVWKRQVDHLRKTIDSPQEEEEAAVPDIDDSRLDSSSPSHQDPCSPPSTMNVSILTPPGQELEPISQTAIVFENTQVDCGEDNSNNVDS